MWRQAGIALAAMVIAASPAFAHGGGGGHGGGRTTYIPIYIPGGVSEVPAAITGDTSQIHSVAIISGMGQSMILGRAGLLAEHTTVDIADWKMDDVVDTVLKRYLAGRFKIVDVPHDSAALAAIPNGLLDSSKAPALQTYLAALPAQGVDAFVVVRPDAEDAAPTPGLSLEDGSGYSLSRPVIRANYEIDIIDAKTFKVISHALSRIALRQGTPAEFSSLLGPADLNITPKQTPTDAQRAGMKKEFSRLISISLIETVRALNLGVALPVAGARVMMPIPQDIRPYPKVVNVAVISAVGDALDINHRAPFFVHTTATVPVADWNLDTTIEGQVRAALDKRFTVKPVAADRAKLAKSVITIDQAGLATTVDGLSPTSDVDAYIVVLKRKSILVLSDEVSGLGIAHQASFGEEHTSAFAIYEIAVVDPHSLKPIALQAGITSPAEPVEMPIHVVDNSVWPKDGALSADEAKPVLPVLTDMLADSVPETLMHLGLTGMMPSGELPPPPSQTPAK